MRVIFSVKRFFACVLFVLCAFLPACGEFTSSWYTATPSRITEDNPTNIVTLSWQSPTTNVDGSPLNDLNRYKVYYGIMSRDYNKSTDVGFNATVSIGELTPGIWYFSVTAIDHSGNESGYSNEVAKAID